MIKVKAESVFFILGASMAAGKHHLWNISVLRSPPNPVYQCTYEPASWDLLYTFTRAFPLCAEEQHKCVDLLVWGQLPCGIKKGWKRKLGSLIEARGNHWLLMTGRYPGLPQQIWLTSLWDGGLTILRNVWALRPNRLCNRKCLKSVWTRK